MEADSPTFADVAGDGALLFLADSSPAPSPSPPAPALSDEFSCYSGSSSSHSSASARSCVSHSARPGRPVDPLRVLSVVASLRRIDPKVLAKATATLLPNGAEKKRKGVWIDIDSDDDDDKNSSAVASEGSTVTGVASAGSTATSGKCCRLPRPGSGRQPGRANAIMQWLSRPQAGPATETAIRAAVGDNSGTGKALSWLLNQEGGLRRAGAGGLADPYVYMVLHKLIL